MLSQAIQQVLFTRPIEKEVPDIVKKYGGSLYIPSPANCFQDSAGTTPCTVDSVVGLMLDTANPVLNRNLFKNTGFLGGVAGSPGTSPTSVLIANAPTGVTRTLAYGITADGKAYVDVTYSGTNTSGATQYPSVRSDPITNPAISGQTFTASVELALISGSWPTGASIQIGELNSSIGFLVGGNTSIKTTITTSTLTKVSHTRTLNNASTAYVSAYPVTFTVNNNEAVNFTVRIANPQLELGSTATNFVPNTYMGYSVNQIEGNHATQGTAGYKPILRGNVKNLFQNSSFSGGVAGSPGTQPTSISIGLAPTGVTRTLAFGTTTDGKPYMDVTYSGINTSGASAFPAAAMSNITLNSASNGQTYTVSAELALLSGNWPTGASIQINQYNSSSAFLANTNTSIKTIVTSASLVKVSHTSTLTNASTAYVTGLTPTFTFANNEAVNFTVRIVNPQLEIGSKASQYVPTPASAAASSSYGPYWLDFDGTDDRLQLGSVPFQLQDDPFAVVGAFIRYSTTVNGRIIDTGSTSARIQIISNNTTGYLGVGFTDDTTASQFLTEAVNSTNTYNVHTLYKLKDVKLNRRNSQQKAINTTALSVSTCTASHIGCAYSPAAFTGMQLYSIALGKGAPLTDISKIEKYAAKLSGAQL